MAKALEYPASYIAYLIEFHAARDYFECHELLEEYWKEHPDDGRGPLWVGLIQIAVGSYHERRGNRPGALKMYAQALQRLGHKELEAAGLEAGRLTAELQSRVARLSAAGDVPFVDMDLPVADSALLAECLRICAQRGLIWGQPSDLTNEALVHRHALRDRSGVIAAREEAAAQKKRDRNG